MTAGLFTRLPVYSTGAIMEVWERHGAVGTLGMPQHRNAMPSHHEAGVQ
jgi:hypothetical protein